MPACVQAICKGFAALAFVAILAPASKQSSPPLSVRLALHGILLEHTTVARYIETALARSGYEVTRQDGAHRQQIEVSLAVARPVIRTFVIGASYSAASYDGSGVAAVMELARMLKAIDLAPGTQLTFVFFVGDTGAAGNFIAYHGPPGESARVRKSLASFRTASTAPAEGLASNAFVEGVIVSGPMMITDADFLRYPYVHTAYGPPDYDNMATQVDNLATLLKRLAAPPSM